MITNNRNYEKLTFKLKIIITKISGELFNQNFLCLVLQDEKTSAVSVTLMSVINYELDVLYSESAENNAFLDFLLFYNLKFKSLLTGNL